MDDLDILTRTLYGESEANNEKDARAIASVIMNRVRYSEWPNSAAAVCLQPWQFSCWNAGDPNRERIMKATSGKWFEQCKKIAKLALDGKLRDDTRTATHYYATYVKAPKWAKGRTPCYKVAHKTGAHVFFNDIDTPAPKTAKEALDQVKPLKKSTTIAASKALTGVGGYITAEGVNQAIEAAAPHAVPLGQALIDKSPIIFAGLLIMGIAAYLWIKRIDDRKKGIK